MPKSPLVKLALVDDHTLFRKGIRSLIETAYENCKILFEADNGIDLQEKIDENNLPDIILLDINMPDMDGFATVRWLNKNHPVIKILIMSMIANEATIVRMLQLGVKGYLSKDVDPKILNEAIYSIMNKGFYYTDFMTGKLVDSMQTELTSNTTAAIFSLMSVREKEFLQLACTEFTYAEIAAKMSLSPKTIDGYRNALFEKLNVKSRVGLALFAVKNGLVNL